MGNNKEKRCCRGWWKCKCREGCRCKCKTCKCKKLKIPVSVILLIGAVLLASAGGAAATPAVRHAISGRHASVTAIVTSSSETAFIRAVLTDVGAPHTSADIGSMVIWYRRESGSSWPPAAQYNPWNTTLPEPGSWDFNSFTCGNGICHVQSYPNATEGAQATAAALENGNYPGIIADLRAGKGLCGNSLSADFLTWSGNGYSGVC